MAWLHAADGVNRRRDRHTDLEIKGIRYESLGEAWGEFNEWIAAHGHRPGPDLWECYITGPESSPDPAAWRTELNRPLIG